MTTAAMPVPARVVRQGIAVCHRQGLTTDQACQIIMTAAAAAMRQAAAAGFPDVAWLQQISDDAARYQARVTRPARPPGGGHDQNREQET